MTLPVTGRDREYGWLVQNEKSSTVHISGLPNTANRANHAQL
jgi:hypothetical protein